jgi:hypothetical protein
MNLKAHIMEICELEKYIISNKEKGWVGSLDNISNEYKALITSVPYSWYFSESLEYDKISDNIKGNDMEFDALLFKLAKLKSRLVAYSDYSTIHIGIEFNELKRHIIEQISKSKLSIEIAVAWISDKDICNELLKAHQRYVQIKILTIDCETNRKALSSLERLLDVRYAKKTGNFMHNKFSIFDNEVVISGSYNWSINAMGNDENIMIVINKEISGKFKMAFNDLWQRYK